MHPFVERVLLLHRLGRRISEAGPPDLSPDQPLNIDDLPLQELLARADEIAGLIARREHLDADDEKAILAAAYLALRRRGGGEPSAGPSSVLRSLLFA
jgi:hypothetical protein